MLCWVEAQIGGGPKLRLAASEQGIRAIEFVREPGKSDEAGPATPLLTEAIRQLESYFRGALREFDLLLDIQGTAFQTRVWRYLLTIPYGQTRSYRQVADALGSPQAVRAVGAANGANPIAIVVPCHRVIGADGRLVGYGGGLPLKKRLLELEGTISRELNLS